MPKSKIVETLKDLTQGLEAMVDSDEELIEDSYNSFLADFETEEILAGTRQYLNANGL